MRILVTGSSSTIGTGVSKRLLADGHEVVALDRLSCPIEHERLMPVECDVRDLTTLTEVSRECDAGIHLAALALASEEMEMISVNVVGAYAFFRAATENGFRMALLAGSAPVHLPQSEFDFGVDNPPSDADRYDVSKSLQEVIAAGFHGHGLPVLCIRLGHVVFGRQKLNLGDPIPLEQLQYCRGGWVALEDVIDACAAALSKPPDARFRICNLVGSRAGRQRFDVRATERHLGLDLRYDFAEFDPGGKLDVGAPG